MKCGKSGEDCSRERRRTTACSINLEEGNGSPCTRRQLLYTTPRTRPIRLPTTTFFSRCPNLTIKIQREGGSLVSIISSSSALLPLLKFIDVFTGSTADDHLNQPPPSAPIPSQQPLPQGESNFGDSSGPLFTIYLRHAEEDDIKMVERWQKDADGIVIFVRPKVTFHFIMCQFESSIERSIFGRRRCTRRRIDPRPPAQLTGYVRFLSWENV